MAEIETIARPYAKAAFKYALDNHELREWLQMLYALSLAVADTQVKRLLSDPKMKKEQLGQFIKDLLSDVLDEHGKNFVSLLAEKKRLTVLGAIYSLYYKLYEEHHQIVTAKVTVAEPLTDHQTATLKVALEKRLNRKVNIESIIDPQVYGGIRVQANDMVIDGTVKARMQRLFEGFSSPS